MSDIRSIFICPLLLPVSAVFFNDFGRYRRFRRKSVKKIGKAGYPNFYQKISQQKLGYNSDKHKFQ